MTSAGDTGEGEEPTEGGLLKESDETFSIWCSGRLHCAGMLVHMQVNQGGGGGEREREHKKHALVVRGILVKLFKFQASAYF